MNGPQPMTSSMVAWEGEVKVENTDVTDIMHFDCSSLVSVGGCCYGSADVVYAKTICSELRLLWLTPSIVTH